MRGPAGHRWAPSPGAAQAGRLGKPGGGDPALIRRVIRAAGIRNRSSSLASMATPASARVGKDTGYYANTRQDVVDALPRPVGAVLDVGCGAGAVGPGLR